MPKVAIIYLLYNGREYLADCFRSLEGVDYPREDAEVIVVDNASNDGGVAFLRSEIRPRSGKELPKITILENKENLGFAEGNNVGMRLALERGFDYVYLLNQDTEVSPEFLREAVAEAERVKEAGSVQSFIMLGTERVRLNSLGNSIHYLGFGYASGYQMLLSEGEAEIEKRRGKDGLVKLAYSSGAGVLYRCSALREAGLFDSELFLYHEDLDLGWRLRMAGYENILASRSVIYHKYEFSRSIKKYYWMERNRFIVMLKLYKLPTLILLLPALILMELGLLAFSARSGWWKEKWHGYSYFYKKQNLKKLWEARREAQKKRKKPDCEIAALFTSVIDFQEFTNPILKYVANPLFTLYWFIVRPFIFW